MTITANPIYATTADYIKAMREYTGLSMQQCQKILKGERLREASVRIKDRVARDILRQIIDDHYPKRP